MKSEPRRLTWPKVLLASLVVPPAGIVMSWLLPWTGGWTRRAAGAAGRLAFSSVLVILTLVYAVALGVLHVEMSGAGWKPIFTLRDPGKDQDALEKHRKEQASATIPAAAATAFSNDVTSDEGGWGPGETAPDTSPAGKAAIDPAGPAWPDFRGPNRDGHYTEGPILTVWPAEGLQRLWRQPAGGGYASFAIANGKAYTIEQRREREVVAAYHVDSGRELWTHGWTALFAEAMGGDGPRATPVWDDGRVYALGAGGELRVLDAESGKLVWSKDILADNGAENITWGMSNSPLVVDDSVIVTPGGPAKSVVAYDKRGGERLWSALSDRAAYTSPMLATLAGQRQIVVVTATRIAGLTVDGGKLLWEFPWATFNDISSAQPIITDPNHVFVSAGYDHGSALLEISREGQGFSARRVWENRSMKNRFNSSVHYQGYIYGLDEGIFACIDANTGERKWKAGRYGYGQLLLAGEHIIVLTESGELVLARANPEMLQEVARFSAIEGKTWNHPAIAGGTLLVRNAREMAAFRIAPTAP
ncbi:MAG: PQQ-like beta-propeller repeat protein [Acidobacteria bacterium]|nr:PQQ-like beta-propeller repeat protein [Acidobacteriota bacterium]